MIIAWTLAALAGVGVVAWFAASVVEQYRRYGAFDKLSGLPTPENIPEGRVVKMDPSLFNEEKWYWEEDYGAK